VTDPSSIESGPIRTFVAAEVPESVKARIAGIVDPLRRQFRLRWTRPEGWHLTLKFLGERTPKEVERIIATAHEVAARVRPFEAALGGWGAFPSPGRPRVLWVGTAVGAEGLIGVATALDKALAEAGFPPEEKEFHPHVTLARVDVAAVGADAFNRLQERPLAPQPFPVDRIVVFRSILDRGGARYHPLAVEWLRGGSRESVE
jgi:2'-5' RNA ligase